MIIWVGCSALFFLFEHGSPTVGGAFANIPDSMYYVAVFLGGEWCHCDFTVPGKLLCIWLVAAGIGLFGIPVGAIFDAFEEIIETNVENAKNERDAEVAAQVRRPLRRDLPPQRHASLRVFPRPSPAHLCVSYVSICFV